MFVYTKTKSSQKFTPRLKLARFCFYRSYINNNMQIYSEWWGVNENITPGELAARAVVMFVIALILMRVSGMRPFGKGDAFDNIITFLMGGILSRGIIGATPFISCVAGGVAIIVLHKILSKLGVYNTRFERITKGKSIQLFKAGEFIERNMKKASISKADIAEELRLNCQLNDLSNIEEVYIERTGQISFVKKKS
jgi:uncharacterized membrane protein YcaP (DUF421 family)